MAVEKVTGIVSGWIKAGITSVLGLVGGALLMYVTPLVNMVIKPAKPLANFAMQVQGTTVVFNNRSQGGSQGWWDFGDGSALEPFSDKQDTISHTYPRNGTFNVKLSLQNLIGEESERTITVEVSPSKDNPTDKVEITEFSVVPKSQPNTLPATFAVRAKLKHAQQCVWDTGEKRPLKFVDSPGETVHQWVTFKEPGRYFVRLAAINGKDIVEKDQELKIDGTPTINQTSGVGLIPNATPLNDAHATLKVTYEAVQVTQQTISMNVPVRWTAGEQDAVSPFAVTQMLDNQWKDYRIVGANFTQPADGHVRNTQLEVAPDRSKFVLRGELVRSTSWLSSKLPHPHWTATIQLKVERRSNPMVVPMDEIPVQLKVPGDTLIPIPPLDSHLQMTKKVMHLEMQDGSNRIWSRDDLPTNVVLQIHNQPMRVQSAEQNGQVILRVTDAATKSAQ